MSEIKLSFTDKQRVIKVIFITMLFAIVSSQAETGKTGSFCLADEGGFSSSNGNPCTAGDIGVNSVKITNMQSTCISANDYVDVSLTLELQAAKTNRYGVGVYINTEGGNALDNGNTCVQDYLSPILTETGALIGTYPSQADHESGTGYFIDLDGDACGDIENINYGTPASYSGLYSKTIHDEIDEIVSIKCSDITGNGYVNIGWGTSYNQSSGGCSSVEGIAPGTSSKCIFDTYDTINGSGTGSDYQIGIPDLTLTISCQASTEINQVECTVFYSNSSAFGVGPANFVEFHINYDKTLGSVIDSTLTAGTPTGDDADDDGSGTITWSLDNGIAIEPGDSGTLTFDINVTNFPEGVLDINTSVDAFFYNPNNAPTSATVLPLDDWSSVELSTLPVTIAYAYPQINGNSLELDFSTATETSNVGFNIYAIKGKKWIQLNEEIMPSVVFDSLVPTDYEVSLDIPEGLKVKKIGIAGVDIDGKEDRHGPYKIGRKSGEKISIMPLKWEKIRKAYKKDKKARKAKRKAKKASKATIKKTMKDQIINVEVSKDGLYRITHEELMAVDIDLRGFKADKIALSLRGEGVARAVEELNKKGKWTKDSTITFMGESPKGSDALYLSSNLYRLSFDKKQVVQSEGMEPVTAKEIVFEANNAYSWTIPGADPFYDKMFYTRGEGKPGVLTRTFTLEEVPDTQMELTVYVSAFSKLTHNLSVALNGSEIGSVQKSGYTELPIKMTVSPAILKKGANQITITALGEGTNIDVFMYDKTVLSYDDGVTNAIQTPVITFNDRLRKKEIKPKRGTNYLIISHPLFLGETLDRYVTQKEGEGWKIQVVDVEDIYSAYGYGMKTPDAIKAYLDVAKRKGVTHVQLVGAASYDYHDYLGLGSVSFIPSIYVPTEKVVNYTPCDGCLVEDENGVPELAIGRWPVRTSEDLETIINKTLTWKNSEQSTAHTALMIADEKESGVNFGKQMDSLSKQFEESNTWKGTTRVYMDSELVKTNNNSTEAVTSARAAILESLNSGVSIVSFSGHSAPTLWSFKRLLTQADAVNVHNEGQTALALPLACYTNYADSPSVKTMAHQFLAEGDNGFVAIYGAATLSNFYENGVSASKVTDHLLKGETIGQAVLKSKRELGVQYSDIIRNSNLLGDVTLEMK